MQVTAATGEAVVTIRIDLSKGEVVAVNIFAPREEQIEEARRLVVEVVRQPRRCFWRRVGGR